ncbi:phosphatidylglycerophosphatase and protein-tyrosine phosphatase 1 [Choloepus didactylus]|uniref:phosphatidylglycerophosphatase and protein-tyrosine phosphatase 1 n=1 Tax=Choloepus didactylus TaxID=27675 RepID=UPI00189ED055|nr:phosphatidylglycerophosphatase and protein-tyrosine phosphatase 1 [Choloepus didactylus]
MGGGHRPQAPSPSRGGDRVPCPGAPGPSPEACGPSSGALVPVSAARGGSRESEGPAPNASLAAEAWDNSQPSSSSSSRLSARPPTATLGTCLGVARSPLRQAGWDGMAVATLLEAGLARLLFYPTLLYTLFRGKMPGRVHRDWYHRIDSTVLLGALPLRSMTRRLVQDENVRGVVTMNEEYETRFLCNSSQEWKKVGVEQLRLSTVDMTGIPTLDNLQKGVQFVLKYRSLGQCVYVHCKAGRSRSATMVAAYLIQVNNCSPEEAVRAITKIRSHIHVRSGQLEVLQEFFKITAGLAKNKTLHTSET